MFFIRQWNWSGQNLLYSSVKIKEVLPTVESCLTWPAKIRDLKVITFIDNVGKTVSAVHGSIECIKWISTCFSVNIGDWNYLIQYLIMRIETRYTNIFIPADGFTRKSLLHCTHRFLLQLTGNTGTKYLQIRKGKAAWVVRDVTIISEPLYNQGHILKRDRNRMSRLKAVLGAIAWWPAIISGYTFCRNHILTLVKCIESAFGENCERNAAAYDAQWALDPSKEMLRILLINIRIRYSKSRWL